MVSVTEIGKITQANIAKLPTNTSVNIGWVVLAVSTIIDGTMKPQIINIFDGSRIPLTRDDIILLLIGIYNAEKNPNADKIASDRVLVRLHQEINYYHTSRKYGIDNILYVSTEGAKWWTVDLNMEIFDTDGNPKDEIVDAIFTKIQRANGSYIP